MEKRLCPQTEIICYKRIRLIFECYDILTIDNYTKVTEIYYFEYLH